MKTKTKVILVKAYILFYLFWILASLYVTMKVGNAFSYGLLVVSNFILLVLMMYFMSKVDLYPRNPNVKPVIKQLNIDGFENFEKHLFQSAKQKKFRDVKQINSDNHLKMQIAFQNADRQVTVLQTVWMDEFDEDLLKEATDIFWKETEEREGKWRIRGYFVVQLIQCIGIPRMNDQANEFVCRNLPQNVYQYQSLNVIAFDEKLVYICQTEDKFFGDPFRRLEGLFLEITEGLFM